ncbi:MAG TPA: N-acetyltransferase [Actinoplanes sp.]|nr:N-acetyltransferase [Actinoplanes sp.]
MDLDIATMADRPDRQQLWDGLLGFWPRFMSEDPTSDFYYGYLAEHFADHCLLAVDVATGEPVAKAHSVPLSYDGVIPDGAPSAGTGAAPGPVGLPEGGWDWAIRRSVHDRLRGSEPVIASAIEILVRPDLRGGGLSGRMLAAMRDNVAKLGFRDLIAPVRPSGKHAHIDTPIDEYAFAQRPDGLPVDPWLRVHVRAGGRIVNVAHSSMVITGTLDRWREWTGLPFDASGPIDVPQALVPVHCDVAQNQAVYVEPNVWVHHRIG